MEKEYNVLLDICINGNLEDLKNFKQLEKFINGYKTNYNIPLISTIINKNFTLADYLISKGANLNLEFNDSKPYKIHIINSIIEMEVDTFYVLDCLEYPEKIDSESLEYIIKKGVNINKVDGRGYTPLDWTIEYNHFTGAKILSAVGAKHSKYFFQEKLKSILEDQDLESYNTIYPHLENLIKNDCLETKKTYIKPKHYAFHYELDRIINNSKRLHKSLKTNEYFYPEPDLGFLENVLKRANINEKDALGRTPVDYALELGHKKAVDYLKNFGGKTSKELENLNK